MYNSGLNITRVNTSLWQVVLNTCPALEQIMYENYRETPQSTILGPIGSLAKTIIIHRKSQSSVSRPQGYPTWTSVFYLFFLNSGDNIKAIFVFLYTISSINTLKTETQNACTFKIKCYFELCLVVFIILEHCSPEMCCMPCPTSPGWLLFLGGLELPYNDRKWLKDIGYSSITVC